MTLFLVATPIGNLDDLSPRAVRTLAEADVVVCEDTRRTGRLLKAAGVTARKLLAVHDHNEEAQVGAVLDHLRAGETVAVVSDAGMPGISDPGERLVRAAVGAGVEVQVVPGPSAAMTARACPEKPGPETRSRSGPRRSTPRIAWPSTSVAPAACMRRRSRSSSASLGTIRPGRAP